MPRPQGRVAKRRAKPYKPRAKPPETSGLSVKVKEIIARTKAWRAARDVEIAGVDISALGPAIEFTGPKRSRVRAHDADADVDADADQDPMERPVRGRRV